MSRHSSVARARRPRVIPCNIAAALLLLPAVALAQPIDLNLFFHDPGAPISIAPDGSAATFAESPDIFDVFLSNVPGFGDPELITAAPGATLAFDFNFDEPSGNADIFHFALLDGATGDPLEPFSRFLTSSGSGSASFDLSSLVGSSLGLQFDLLPDLPDDQGFGSTVTISNLRIETPVTAVPLPGTLGLISSALLAVPALGRRLRFSLR